LALSRRAVASSGDTVVAGAPGTTITAEVAPRNAAYIFRPLGKLTASDGAAWDYFGNSVAISGDTVVVGAPGADIGSDINRGSAYVFARSGASWIELQKLAAGEGANDGFGYSVAISGNTIVVGALSDSIGSNTSQGSAYVFVRSGASWIEQRKLTADDGAAGDNFGASVAISGDTVVVGAPLD